MELPEAVEAITGVDASHLPVGLPLSLLWVNSAGF